MFAAAFTAISTMVPAPRARIGPMPAGRLALGFDFGTSGARCAALGTDGAAVFGESVSWGVARERSQTAADWVDALHALLDAVPADVRARVSRIAVSGTSATCLLCDSATREPSAGRGAPRMYDYSVAKQAPGGAGAQALKLIGEHAPPLHTTRGASSALAKLVAWHFEEPLRPGEVRLNIYVVLSRGVVRDAPSVLARHLAAAELAAPTHPRRCWLTRPSSSPHSCSTRRRRANRPSRATGTTRSRRAPASVKPRARRIRSATRAPAIGLGEVPGRLHWRCCSRRARAWLRWPPSRGQRLAVITPNP